MGVLPGGRGNDFARALGIPLDPRAACQVLATGTTRSLDLGEVNGRTFVGIASCGFDADANRIANRSRYVGGNLVYTYARAARAGAVESGGVHDHDRRRAAAHDHRLHDRRRQLQLLWWRYASGARALARRRSAGDRGHRADDQSCDSCDCCRPCSGRTRQPRRGGDSPGPAGRDRRLAAIRRSMPTGTRSRICPPASVRCRALFVPSSRRAPSSRWPRRPTSSPVRPREHPRRQDPRRPGDRPASPVAPGAAVARAFPARSSLGWTLMRSNASSRGCRAAAR